MNRLRQVRLSKGMNQQELAEILQVTQAAVANWEAGTAYPRAAQLPELAAALHCTIDELYQPPEESA